MAMTPEGRTKAQVVKLLKAHEAYYFFPATHGMGRSGVPDVVCCVRGKFVAVECKAGKNTTTALQDREIKAIQTARGIAVVINETNLELLETILKELTA